MQNGLKIDMKAYMQNYGEIVSRWVIKVIDLDKTIHFSFIGLGKVGFRF